MNLTGWLEYFAEGLATQLREIQERGEQVIRHDVILSRARRVGIKPRPVSLLGFPLERGQATVAEAEAALGGNRRTLQRDLKLLAQSGFIREVATGPTDPTKYYEPLL